MPRLRRADCGAPGLTRRRRGRGFVLLDEQGRTLEDPELVERVNALRIPPAWRDVWICPDPLGHLQATGTDAAGRRQYLYHPEWHAKQARAKFADMVGFARSLPGLRERVAADLAADGFERDRVLACTVRLLDLGFFRIGCEEYAERNDTYGLATMKRTHVRVDGEHVVFDYPAKSGQRRVQHVVDADCAELVAALKRRRGGNGELFAFKRDGRWCDVRSGDINAYLKDACGVEATAKDFRTWNATVLAAVALAVSAPAARTAAARKRAATRAVKEVAGYLGNTPAVCRASYIDPRVFDRFDAGLTIAGVLAEAGDPSLPGTQGVVEEAVIELLEGERGGHVVPTREILALAA